MQEKRMVSINNQDVPRRQPVASELGGKWIAWSSDGLRIIAHADTLDECETAAAAAGDSDPSFEKVPHSHVRIVGLGR
jgi:hypothetical protein